MPSAAIGQVILGRKGRRVVVGASGPTYDADAAAYFAAMSVQPDATRKGLINDLIVGLKADGVWSLLDLFYLLASHDAQAARLNAKAPATFALTATGTVTFTTDRGYKGDGSTGYLATGFNPTTAPTPNWTQNSASLFTYINAATSDALTADSVWGDQLNQTRLQPWVAVNSIGARVNSGSMSFSAAVTSRLGSTCASRTAANATNVQKGGAAFGATSTTASSAVAANTIDILRYSTTFNGNDRIACAALGGGLSGAQMTALHARTLTFLTAIGAN